MSTSRQQHDVAQEPGAPRRGRRAVVAVLAGLAVALVGVLAASAGTTPPTLTVTPSATYAELTVDLSEALYAGTGKQPLSTTSFALVRSTADGTPVAGTSTQPTTAERLSDTRYKLTFATPAVPNASAVEVRAPLHDGGGTAVVGPLRQVVPLTGSGARDAAQQLRRVSLDLRHFGGMPFVGAWFANDKAGAATAYDAGLAGLATPTTTTTASASPSASPVAAAKAASSTVSSGPRPLGDLLTTLDTVLAGLPTTTTQAAVVQALDGIPGVERAVFGGTAAAPTLRLDLDDTEDAVASAVSRQVTRADAVPFHVSRDTTFALGLDGSLTVGPQGLSALALDVLPRPTLPDELPARLGIVSVDADVDLTTSGLTGTLTCAAPCTAPVPDAAGTVALDLEGATYDDGTRLDQAVDLTSGTGPVTVTWDLSAWPVAPDPQDGVDEALQRSTLQPVPPSVTGRSAEDAARLQQFRELDTRAVVLGLEWVGTWLRSLDDVGAFGQSLPVVGLSAGEVLDLSAQVGRKVTDLVEAVEAEGTAGLVADPSAQELVGLLCASDLLPECPQGKLPGLRVTEDEISYDLRFDVCQALFGARMSAEDEKAGKDPCDEEPTVDVTEGGPPLDLSLTDVAPSASALPGMQVTLRAGTWQGTARASLAFRLALDLRPDAELGAVDTSVPEGLEDARVGAKDVCRVLALGMRPGFSTTALAALNSPTVGGRTTPALVDGEPTPACRHVAWDDAGTVRTVALPPPDTRTTTTGTTPAPAPKTQVPTAEDLCRGAAYQQGVELPLFLEVNGGMTVQDCARRVFRQADEDADALAKAAADEAAGRTPAPVVLTEPAFRYFAAPDEHPVGARLSLQPLGTQPLAKASVDVRSGEDGFGGDATLGFLDLGFTGSAALTPKVEVSLTDDDLTLVELAESADAASGTVGLVTTKLDGDLDVDLTLTNSVAFPASDPAVLRVHDSLTDLMKKPALVKCEERASEQPDGVCYSLGAWTDLDQLTPAQVLRMVSGLVDRLAAISGAGEAKYTLPFVGVSMQDLVSFNRRLADFADAVEASEPQDLSALQEALDAALVSAGLPAGTVEVALEGGVLSLALPMEYSEGASYPFSFDVGLGQTGGLPLRIAPVDGGALLTATGTVTATPKLGIDLAAPSTTPLDQRLFLLVDPETDPTISGGLGARVKGDVALGPLTTSFAATSTGSAEATLRLSGLVEDPADEGESRLTLARLAQVVKDGPGKGFVDWGGKLALKGSVEGPTGPLTLAWEGDLKGLAAGGKGTFTEVPDVTSWTKGLKLDLQTLVRGTSMTSRFVGRALAQSEALETSLPMVGDELGKLAKVGQDLQTFSQQVDAAWVETQKQDRAFVQKVNGVGAGVCGSLAAAGACQAELVVYKADGTTRFPKGEEQLTEAGRVELRLSLAKEYTRTLPAPTLLDLPGFELGTETDLEVQAGYKVALTLGVSMEDGFYVKGADRTGTKVTRLLELYAGVSLEQLAEAEGQGLKVGGVTVFTFDALSMTLGGTLGPGGKAAGFALDMARPLTLADLGSRRKTVDSILEPKISIKATGLIAVKTPSTANMPTLRFPLHFGWEVEGRIGKGLEIAAPTLSIGKRDAELDDIDGYVTLDASGMIDGVVRPALLELNKYNPVAKADPIKKALATKIPVADQSVRALLEVALGDDPSWKLFTFLLDLDEVASSITASEGSKMIPLGGYQVLPAKGEGGFFSPKGSAGFWDLPAEDYPEVAFLGGIVERLSSAAGGPKTFTPRAPRTPPAPDSLGTGPAVVKKTSTVPVRPTGRDLGKMVSFPILDDPMTAATLLFGGDAAPVSFIEIAPPPVTLGYSLSFSRTLFDLDVGFLSGSLSVNLDGAVGVTLRVGLGYSSHGLTTGKPENGLYLLDAYDGTEPLPFVALTGRVAAGVNGRFSVAGIAEATFHGSGYVKLEGGLDLLDESEAVPEEGRGDGKFHLDEMAAVKAGHRIKAGAAPSAADTFCIFRPQVSLTAGLSFGGAAKVAGIQVWSGSYSNDWKLVDESFTCPLAYRLARMDERRLVLNAGPDAAERSDAGVDGAEGFVVTLTDDKQRLRVTGTGSLADQGAYAPMEFPVAAVDEVFVDLGAGNDTLTVSSAVTTPVVALGGDGDDVLLGGGGGDTLDAGAGLDRVEGRGGDDLVTLGADAGAHAPLAGQGAQGACTGALADAMKDADRPAVCSVVVLGAGDDVVTGGPAPVLYRAGTTQLGAVQLEHTGSSGVLDLRGSTAGFTGTVDLLGGQFDAKGGGSITTSDPLSLSRILGSAGADTFRIVDGPLGLYVDGAGGVDAVTVETNGNDRSVRVHDSGGGKTDTLSVRGTAGTDRILMRAYAGKPPTGKADPAVTGWNAPADRGLVAILSRGSSSTSTALTEGPTPARGQTEEQSRSTKYTGLATSTQLVYYDDSLGRLHVDGVAGQDEIALDDVAASATIDTGRGSGKAGATVQVGQIYGWYDDVLVPPTGDVQTRKPLKPQHPVAEKVPAGWEEGFRYRESIRGWLSFGVSHPTTVQGGDGPDAFTVYSNVAKLDVKGGAGDDVFTLRAFIENGSIKKANGLTAEGGAGNDTFEYDFSYVANEAVKIDGGDGANTLVAIGTEGRDGFLATTAGVSICPLARLTDESPLDARLRGSTGVAALPLGGAKGCAVQAEVDRVQRYVLYGLDAHDVFQVTGRPAETQTWLIGGRNGGTYLLGDDDEGTDDIAGSVEVVADLDNLSPGAREALDAVDLDFPLPVLLRGEVAYSPVAAVLPPGFSDGGDPEHRAFVDASGGGGSVTGVLSADSAAQARGVRLTRMAGVSPPKAATATAGIGLNGLDRLRVVLGEDADSFTVRTTLQPYTLPVTPVPPSTATATTRKGLTEVHLGGGKDEVQVDEVAGPSRVLLGDGDDGGRVGTGAASGVRADLDVRGGPGTDTFQVDVRLRTAGLRADVARLPAHRVTFGASDARTDETLDVGRLTGLDMLAPVRHDASLEVFRVLTGSGADTTNVTGTLAPTQTQLRSSGGADRVLVSDKADVGALTSTPGLLPGTLDALRGDLDVDAGSGRNLLMVSDRAHASGRTATLSADRFAPVGLGAVAFRATGGDLSRGATFWTGSGADTVTVTGARREAVDDPALLAWEGRSPAATATVRTLTTLSTGAGADRVTAAVTRAHGLLVTNLEDGDDTYDGSASSRATAVFGGDGADRITTGSGDDLVLGDHGRVGYGPDSALTGVLGVPERMDLVTGAPRAPTTVGTCTSRPGVVGKGLTGCTGGAVASGTLATQPPGATGVRNWISTGDGDDVAFGGEGSDWLEATGGANALVGDGGTVRRVTPAELGGRRTLRSSDGFVVTDVVDSPFHYVVDLDTAAGTADVVQGGRDRDWVLGGQGDDLVAAGAGPDLVFGGDGSDALWGGAGDDRVYAGAGEDLVDLKRMGAEGTKRGLASRHDWPIGPWWTGRPVVGTEDWHRVTPVEDADKVASTVNGSDLVFGADGQDTLQADVGGAGRTPGDRLLDWYGGYNAYYVCSGAYGAGYVLRMPSPSVQALLQTAVPADGVVAADAAGQLALPVTGNRSPVHPAHPGNSFGC